MSDEDMIRRGDAIAAVQSSPFPIQAVAAIPAVQVAVKPLEWLEIRHGQYFEARVIGILYSVRLGTDGISRWQAGHMGTWRDAPTIEAAKADAQADYDARIRSALTAQPSPDVAALVDALHNCVGMLDHLVAESGRAIEWGAEDPFRMGEWFEPEDLAQIEQVRAALARLKGGAA